MFCAKLIALQSSLYKPRWGVSGAMHCGHYLYDDNPQLSSLQCLSARSVPLVTRELLKHNGSFC